MFFGGLMVTIYFDPQIQLILLALTNFIEIAFLAFVRPYKSWIANMLSLINEVCFLAGVIIYMWFQETS